jgi:hypothetical protein
MMEVIIMPAISACNFAGQQVSTNAKNVEFNPKNINKIKNIAF